MNAQELTEKELESRIKILEESIGRIKTLLNERNFMQCIFEFEKLSNLGEFSEFMEFMRVSIK